MDSMETVIKKENQKVLNTGSISTPSWSNCQKKDNCSFGDNWLSWRVVYKANATKKEDTVIKKKLHWPDELEGVIQALSTNFYFGTKTTEHKQHRQTSQSNGQFSPLHSLTARQPLFSGEVSHNIRLPHISVIDHFQGEFKMLWYWLSARDETCPKEINKKHYKVLQEVFPFVLFTSLKTIWKKKLTFYTGD